MALKDTKFDAFISYRHAELDKFVAESLHKRLEAFRVPSSVRRKNKLTKDRIRRVFRDRDELPLASDLAEQITDALQNSEFLIVICTPRLPESKWCRKEIETFIEMHGRKNVFAVLAEGEPSESFPDLLLYDEKEVVSDTGVTEIVRVPVEPLAADVRGENKKEIRKKMDEELLRLVAPMFNLNYDDLKQRHREQKMKRIVSLSMIISAIFIVFGLFSGILSLKISQQANEIYEQNTLIQNKNNEISQQAELLQQQNEELQKSYAVSMALEAQELMADGRYYDALYAVRNAMPDSTNDASLPYSADAHRSLADILQVYKSPQSYFPQNNYDVSAPVNNFKISDDGTKLLISDMSDTLTLWETKTQECLASFPLHDGHESITYYFIDNNTLIFSSKEKIIKYDIASQSSLELYDAAGDILLIPASDDIILIESLQISRISVTGEVIWQLHTLEYGFYSTEDMFITDDASLVIMPVSDQMLAINAENGDIVYALPHTTFEEYMLFHSSLYIMDSNSDTSRTTIFSYDVTTGNKIWEKTYPVFFYDIYFATPEGKYPLLITHSYDEAYAIDVSNAEIVSTAIFDKRIIAITSAPNDGTPIITLSSNIHYLFMPEENQAIQITLADRYKPQAQIMQVNWIPGAVFYAYVDTPMVSLYTSIDNEDSTAELGDKKLINYSVNHAGTIRLEWEASTGYLYNIQTNELLNTLDLTDSDFCFVKDGSEYYSLTSNNICTIYSLKDHVAVHTIKSDNALITTEDYVLESVKTESERIGRVHLLDDFNSTYDLPENVYLSFLDLYISDDTLPYALVNSLDGIITIGHLQNPDINITIQTSISSILSCALSNDGKYFFVEHDDARIEIYDMTDGTIKNILYDTCMDIGYVEYIPDLNSYFAYSRYGSPNYILTKNMEVCSEIPTALAYNKQDKVLICYSNSVFYAMPFYHYDELIQMADAILGDYAPSQKIKRKHNI